MPFENPECTNQYPAINSPSGVVWHLPTGESKSFKVSVPQVPDELHQIQSCSLSVYCCRTVNDFFIVESFLCALTTFLL